jgi:hypothetical protein
LKGNTHKYLPGLFLQWNGRGTEKDRLKDLPGFENLAGLREGIPLLHYQVEDIFLPAGTITIL